MQTTRTIQLFFIKTLGIIALLLTTALTLNAQEKSLYDRFGGYEAISAVVDDFADRLFSDP